MIDNEIGADWQTLKNRLITAEEQLEKNDLYHRIMQHCRIKAAVMDKLAGQAGTDREMNRLHGHAEGLRDMMGVAKQIVDETMDYYNVKQRQEEMDNGEAPFSKSYGGTSNPAPYPKTGKVPRRRNPPDGENDTD